MFPKSSGYSPVPTSEAIPPSPAPPPPFPATIPITISSPPPPPPPPTTTTAIFTPGDLLSQIKSQSQTLIAAQRPWPSVLNAAAISVPSSPSVALQRFLRNASYFRSNYALAIVVVAAVSLLSHPFSLLLGAGLAAAWFSLFLSRPPNSGPVVIGRRTFDDSAVLGFLSLATLFLFLFTDLGSILFGAFVLGFAIVVAHGIFRQTDDLPVDQLPVTMPAAAVQVQQPQQQTLYTANGNSSATAQLPVSRPY